MRALCGPEPGRSTESSDPEPMPRSLSRLSGYVLAMVALGGCQSAAPPRATDDVQVAEQPVAVDVEKDVNAALFAGEFAWQDGRGKSAATHYLRAAKLSSD